MGNAFIFIIGATVGSFLNVCIHRLPLGESIVAPPSQCPRCRRHILWYDNIPLVSIFILKGRCRFCHVKISPRYFLVEFLTAVVFLLLYQYNQGINSNFFLQVILSCGLIVATFVDMQHRIIPDEVTIGGMLIGFLLRLFSGLNLSGRKWSLAPALDSCLGIIIGGGIIWLVGFLFDLIYFKLLRNPPIQGETESMGGGDVKLLAMIGAFLGWQQALVTFFLAPFFGALIGIINLLTNKDHTIPYGPFLSLAAFICIFWFQAILGFIFLVH